MSSMGGVLRDRLQRPGIVVAPGVTDALTARLAASLGFDAVYLGGYTMGQVLGMTEPQMTLTETVDFTRQVAAAAGVPLIVDGNAGFGDDTHTRRAVELLSSAGAAAIHIEDQVFPKRARYFEGHKYVIDRADAERKIRYARDGLRGSDTLLIGRTDAREAQGGGLEEAVLRCRLFLEAGADVVMPYGGGAPSVEEAEYVGGAIAGPLLYVNSEGKTGYPRIRVEALETFGWKIVVFNLATLLSAYQANRDTLIHIRDNGLSDIDSREAAGVRTQVEELSGLPDMYLIEREVDDAPK